MSEAMVCVGAARNPWTRRDVSVDVNKLQDYCPTITAKYMSPESSWYFSSEKEDCE